MVCWLKSIVVLDFLTAEDLSLDLNTFHRCKELFDIEVIFQHQYAISRNGRRFSCCDVLLQVAGTKEIHTRKPMPRRVSAGFILPHNPFQYRLILLDYRPERVVDEIAAVGKIPMVHQ